MVQPEPRPPQGPRDEPPQPDRRAETGGGRTPPPTEKRIERYPER